MSEKAFQIEINIFMMYSIFCNYWNITIITIVYWYLGPVLRLLMLLVPNTNTNTNMSYTFEMINYK